MSLAKDGYGLPKFFGILAVMTSQSALERFGAIVRQRREDLGLQQEEMVHHNGPSSTTLSRIERAVAPPSPKTLRKLDEGLRWQTGSARRTLEGGEPTPLAPQTTVEKPLRAAGQTTTSYRGKLQVPELLTILDASVAAASRIKAAALESSLSPTELGDTLNHLRGASHLVVLACEVLGENLSAEDVSDEADISALAAALDVYADQIDHLRKIAHRLSLVLTATSVNDPEAVNTSINAAFVDAAEPKVDRVQDQL